MSGEAADRLRAAAAPERLAEFVLRRLRARDESGFWLCLVLLFGAVGSVAYLASAFAEAGSVQDDTRMFLAWMGRWDDPAALQGDLMADYWQSVSPWLFSALFRLAWLAGIEPVLFAKLLPAALFPLIAWYAYRFVRAIGADPAIAFATSLFALHECLYKDFVVSGTPRAFWPLLILVVLDGLARRRPLQTALGQLALCGTYPQLGLVTATVVGLTLFEPGARFLVSLERRRVLMVAAAAAATIAGILPFLLASSPFEPTVTLAEARTIPTFAHGGRGAIFEPDGSLDFVCQRRLGFFANACTDFPVLAFLGYFAALAAGPVVLFLRTLRPAAAPRTASRLPLYLLLACTLWFALSALLLFRLHLPSRYTFPVYLAAQLATVPLLLEWLRARRWPGRLSAGRGRRAAVLGGAALAAVLALLLATDVKRG
ncbi:hypothetical protein, partial [Propylenella binzhouense]